jgi:hypothetical protein
VRERSFQPSELGTVIEFVVNHRLFKDSAAIKAAADTWPLQTAQLLNGPYRSGGTFAIEPDATWADMWRVILPNDQLSDMVNLTRAKDAVVAARSRFAKSA